MIGIALAKKRMIGIADQNSLTYHRYNVKKF